MVEVIKQCNTQAAKEKVESNPPSLLGYQCGNKETTALPPLSRIARTETSTILPGLALVFLGHCSIGRWIEAVCVRIFHSLLLLLDADDTDVL